MPDSKFFRYLLLKNKVCKKHFPYRASIACASYSGFIIAIAILAISIASNWYIETPELLDSCLFDTYATRLSVQVSRFKPYAIFLAWHLV